jgi:hypothetical protein
LEKFILYCFLWNECNFRYPIERRRVINSDLQKELLDLISKSGKTEDLAIKVNVNIHDILTFSSGAARLHSTVIRKAVLILSQPLTLQSLSSLQIRCILCKRVISYPCWYYEVKYAVNHFHYFICFQPSADSTKPSMKCYKEKT